MANDSQNIGSVWDNARTQHSSNFSKLACNRESVVSLHPSPMHLTIILPKSVIAEPSSVKENLWKGGYVDILSLLLSSKEFLAKLHKKAEDHSEEDRRSILRTFQN